MDKEKYKEFTEALKDTDTVTMIKSEVLEVVRKTILHLVEEVEKVDFGELKGLTSQVDRILDNYKIFVNNELPTFKAEKGHFEGMELSERLEKVKDKIVETNDKDLLIEFLKASTPYNVALFLENVKKLNKVEYIAIDRNDIIAPSTKTNEVNNLIFWDNILVDKLSENAKDMKVYNTIIDNDYFYIVSDEKGYKNNDFLKEHTYILNILMDTYLKRILNSYYPFNERMKTAEIYNLLMSESLRFKRVDLLQRQGKYHTKDLEKLQDDIDFLCNASIGNRRDGKEERAKALTCPTESDEWVDLQSPLCCEVLALATYGAYQKLNDDKIKKFYINNYSVKASFYNEKNDKCAIQCVKQAILIINSYNRRATMKTIFGKRYKGLGYTFHLVIPFGKILTENNVYFQEYQTAKNKNMFITRLFERFLSYIEKHTHIFQEYPLIVFSDSKSLVFAEVNDNGEVNQLIDRSEHFQFTRKPTPRNYKNYKIYVYMEELWSKEDREKMKGNKKQK